MSTIIAEGGCMCGAVRYRAIGKPTNTMVCHCRSCRRVAGSPVVAWVTFPAASFVLIKGQPAEFRSSQPVLRTFCSRCGTPLTYRHDDSPDYVDVTTCSLDDPEAFPPTHHSWMSDNVGWIRFGDALPTFERFRPPAS